MRTPFPRPVVALAAISVLLTSATAAPASSAAAGPLADVHLAIGDQHLFTAYAPGPASGEKGRWSFDHGRLAQGRLELSFEIDPAPHSLPVRSGPAVLFAGLRLYGDAGGDVGLEQILPTITHAAVPTCTDDAECHYSADIAIPADEIRPAIERLERQGDLEWASVRLTLVRTFGDGQWLEVLPFEADIMEAQAGRLGAMEPTAGAFPWSGLFPTTEATPFAKDSYEFKDGLDYPAITERLRLREGDTSTPMPMADVDLSVQVEPACDFNSELWIHDDMRNHLFTTLTDAKTSIQAKTRMPLGIPWFLTLAGGGGISAPAARLGPIVARESHVEIRATYGCEPDSGSLELVGAVSPTPGPSLRPQMPSASGATPPPGSSAPATVAPLPEETEPARPAPSSADDTVMPGLLVIVLVVVAVGGAYALRVGRRP